MTTATLANVTTELCFELSREGYRLLSLDAPKGRTLRRFLDRIANNGMVVQVLTSQTPTDQVARKQLRARADEMRTETNWHMEQAAGRAAALVPATCGPVLDEDFGVLNFYKFNIDLKTACVRDLRKLLGSVMAISDTMHAFVSEQYRATSGFDTHQANLAL